jgi:hypothetical protein
VAVEKVFTDDLSGEPIPREDVLIIRVGTLADRPEDCERFDIGPASFTRSIAELVTAFTILRKEASGGDETPA